MHDLIVVGAGTAGCVLADRLTPGAVVDPHLDVVGTEGLRVADASVMPSVPRGHPNAAVAMIAQRAAEWIERACSSP